MNLRSRKKRNRGYLLVEVLVTVLVLGVAIVFIVRALSASLVASRRAAYYTKGLLLAEQLQAQMKVEALTQPASADSFPRSAESSAENTAFSWKEDATLTDIPPLAEIIFTVIWRDAKINGEFSASTLMPIVTSE